MYKKEMMVFYVPEELDYDRMGTPNAYCLAFDGLSCYRAEGGDLPNSFEDMSDFLKNNEIVVQKCEYAIALQDNIIQSSAKGLKRERISDFKFGEPVSLGMGNLGNSLGQITVNVVVDNE